MAIFWKSSSFAWRTTMSKDRILWKPVTDDYCLCINCARVSLGAHEIYKIKFNIFTGIFTLDWNFDFPEYPANWSDIKKRVLQRDGYRCSRCGANNLSLHVHHKRSLSHGGSNNPNNLITLCEYCHSRMHSHMKSSGRTPAHISIELFYHCQRCDVEYGIDFDSRFCPTCDSFLIRKSKETISPVKMPSEGCFIATAAYGTEFSENLHTFRSFRDNYLLRNKVGTVFTRLYYRLSPPLANLILVSEQRRLITRTILRLIRFFLEWWLWSSTRGVLLLRYPRVKRIEKQLSCMWSSLQPSG